MVSLLRSTHQHALALLFAGLMGSGCYASTRGYVVTDAPPAYIETYPSYYYEGRTVYLVDGRWYTRDRGHWVYYRREPPELYRYRTTVRVAPPAYRAPPARYERREYRRGAPPAYRREAAPSYRRDAPPASGGPRHGAPPASRGRPAPRRHAH